MIREHHRVEILRRLRNMRRAKTVYEKSKEEFVEILREANLETASQAELAKLVGLSRQRITQLLEKGENE